MGLSRGSWTAIMWCDTRMGGPRPCPGPPLDTGWPNNLRSRQPPPHRLAATSTPRAAPTAAPRRGSPRRALRRRSGSSNSGSSANANASPAGGGMSGGARPSVRGPGNGTRTKTRSGARRRRTAAGARPSSLLMATGRSARHLQPERRPCWHVATASATWSSAAIRASPPTAARAANPNSRATKERTATATNARPRPLLALPLPQQQQQQHVSV